MAINRKISPVGIDIVIDILQEALFNGLTSVGWTDYESYPRAYKNQTKDGFIPEFYTGNEEYEEVYFDDGFNVTSFWLVEDTVGQQNDPNFSATIKVIFQAKLNELYPSIPHRADEEMHRDIALILDKSYITINGNTKITTGIEKIYENEGLKSTTGFEDMSNFHVVKFDVEVNYEYDSCN